ncbi:MAG TPA: hypothetical protein VFX21_16120 [Acidimicrobiia bacterium]|nr:hypothetical protein [Acidimicrobiia bacterium]
MKVVVVGDDGRTVIEGAGDDLMAEIRVRRGILKRVTVSAVVVASLALAAFAVGVGTPQRPKPDTDINAYALLGWDSVNIKGKQAALVRGGNIGVVNKKGTATICVNGALSMDAGSQVVADKVKTGTRCDLGDVFSGDGTPGAGTYDSWSKWNPPLALTNVPAIPSIDRCDESKPITVVSQRLGGQPEGPAHEAPPATYGAFTMKDEAAYKLRAGNYVFCSVTIGKGVALTIDPGTTVTVLSTFSISNNSAIKGAGVDNARWTVLGRKKMNKVTSTYGKLLGPSETVVNFSKHTEIHSTFFAPNNTIGLGNDTSLFGHFWARRLISDANIRVTTPTTQSTTTTTVRANTSTSTSTTSTTRPSSTSSSSSSTTTAPKGSTSTSSTTSTTRPSSSTSSSTSTTTTSMPVSTTEPDTLPDP